MSEIIFDVNTHNLQTQETRFFLSSTCFRSVQSFSVCIQCRVNSSFCSSCRISEHALISVSSLYVYHDAEPDAGGTSLRDVSVTETRS